MSLVSIDPTTETEIARYEELGDEALDRALAAVDDAARQWVTSSFAKRAEHMERAAQTLEAGKNGLAELMAREMGKPLAQGQSEIDKCAWVCRHYAKEAERYLTDEAIATEAKKSYVAFRPLGVVLAVMPWNFPFWQVFRFAAPALMAGNGAVLKHASNVYGCAYAIENVFRAAGLPEDLFRTLPLSSKRVERVIADPRVVAVTLTGSSGAGRSVASAAGQHLKKTVLELGGSDPYLVLEDADLDHAADTCVASRLINSGQSCIAAKRFIVARSVADDFTERFIARMREKKMGPPLERGVDLGPQARTDLRDSLHDQVKRSVDRGAVIALGGEVPSGKGAFYPPSVLTDVKPGMPAFDEELFGPVAAIIKADDERHAIELANRSTFGLGAAVFSRDEERAERIAKQDLQAGACFVNDLVKSDPRLPFGGIKESGYGRELAAFGIREFVNIKTVSVR